MILQRVLCQNVILKLKLVNYFSRSGGKLNEITDATLTKTDSRGKQIAWLKVLFERKVDFFFVSFPTRRFVVIIWQVGNETKKKLKGANHLEVWRS